MALKLDVIFGMNAREFHSGLAKAKNSVNQFGKMITSRLAAAFGVAAITAGVKNLVQEGGRIRDMSRAVGLTAEEFQALDYAAKQTNTTVEAFTRGIVLLAKNQQSALSGQKTIQEMFSRLGVSMDDLRAKTPQQIFRQIAQAAETGSLGVQNLADFTRIFGETGQQVLPAMQDGLASLVENFGQMGMAINDTTVEELAAMGDKWTEMTQQLKTGLAPVVIWIMEKIRELVNWVTWAVKVFEGLVTGFVTTEGSIRDRLTAAAATSIEAGRTEMQRQIEEEDARKTAANIRREAREGALARAAAMQEAINQQTAEASIKKTGGSVAKAAAFQPFSDQLAKVGGFVGGGNVRSQTIQERIAKATELTAKNSEKTNYVLMRGV